MSIVRFCLACIVMMAIAISCSNEGSEAAGEVEGAAAGAGQSGVQDNESAKDIVKVAVGSPDHKTLVAALQAAELVDALSNAGPFTVFAPTDAAFGQLPAGTVEELVKPENKEKLANILYHHVQVSSYTEERLKGSTSIVMFDGKPEPVTFEGDAIFIGGAKILGKVQASNGVVYVVDKVILAD